MEAFLPAEEQAFQYVIGLIVAHELQPGDRMYEPELVQKMGMSRTPIRTALSRLVADGVLEKVHGQRGYQVPKLSLEDMEKVFTARQALEGMIAREAAIHRTELEVEELWKVNEREMDIVLSRKEATQLNELFHRKLVRMARNEYLERSFEALYLRSSLYIFYFGRFFLDGQSRELSSHREGNNYTYEEHRAIIQAVSDQNGELARQLMEQHVYNTWRIRVINSPFFDG
ncbi:MULTISPECIES: GntR family transcriptional regulator [Aminobacterium]|jgi:DNA-binding GntR family transcriptional regulator|uniref:GntR family transcriptional regulator n=2 Tax=Aminobacteriaceae TaxID=3029087 RepID=UPI00257AEF84|nr:MULTISPECIES: GntR family transcriptional regulator [unclassified Aminobacterium]